jgi:membrane protease YdiL (CAAX protease family)
MIWGVPLLIVVGILLPGVAIVSRRASARASESETGAEPSELPSTNALALQSLVLQAFVSGLASLALRAPGVAVTWRSETTIASVTAGGAVVLVALVAAWIEARKPLGPDEGLRRRLRSLRATDPIWLAVIVAAAVGEEFAYRGVLTSLLEDGMGFGFFPAAIISAVLFGLGHASQGWRGFASSAGFGLAMQVLVSISGGLCLAMIAHFAYDLSAAAIGRRLAKRASAGLRN